MVIFVCLAIIAALTYLNFIQLSRAKWIHEQYDKLYEHVEDLNASVSEIARTVQFDLQRLAQAHAQTPPRPRARRMPLVDRRTYGRDEGDNARTLPGHWSLMGQGHRQHGQAGQGLIEYALIITFVAIVVVGGL